MDVVERRRIYGGFLARQTLFMGILTRHPERQPPAAP